MGEYDDVPEDIAKAIIDYTESTGKFEGWSKIDDPSTSVTYKIRVNNADIRVKKWWEKKAFVPYKIEYCVEFNDKHYHGRNAGLVYDSVHEKFGSYLEEQNRLTAERRKIEKEQKRLEDSKKAENAFREKVLGKM